MSSSSNSSSSSTGGGPSSGGGPTANTTTMERGGEFGGLRRSNRIRKAVTSNTSGGGGNTGNNNKENTASSADASGTSAIAGAVDDADTGAPWSESEVTRFYHGACSPPPFCTSPFGTAMCSGEREGGAWWVAGALTACVCDTVRQGCASTAWRGRR
jgi:hypothetical protein